MVKSYILYRKVIFFITRNITLTSLLLIYYTNYIYNIYKIHRSMLTHRPMNEHDLVIKSYNYNFYAVNQLKIK